MTVLLDVGLNSLLAVGLVHNIGREEQALAAVLFNAALNVLGASRSALAGESSEKDSLDLFLLEVDDRHIGALASKALSGSTTDTRVSTLPVSSIAFEMSR